MGNIINRRSTTNRPRAIVKSTDMVLEDLRTLMESVTSTFLKDKDPNIYNLVLAAMHTIEQYTTSSAQLSSQDKLRFALELLPHILQYLVSQHSLTDEKRNEIVDFIKTNDLLIRTFVNVAVNIAKHPYLIQAQEHLSEKCKSCCP